MIPKYYFISLMFFIFLFGFLIVFPKQLGKVKDECYSGKQWQLTYMCYEKETLNIATQKGIKAALTYVNDVVKVNSPLPTTVHRLYHAIGHHAYLLTRDPNQALSYLGPYDYDQEQFDWSDFPLDGYRHGVTMMYFKDKKGEKPIADLMRDICGKFLDISSFRLVTPRIAVVAQHCFHMVGHGLMAMNGNDVAVSLPYCDLLPQEWMQKRCYFGVFMENAYLYAQHDNYNTRQEPRPSVKGKSMKSLCGEFDGWKKYECSRFVGWSLFSRNGNFTDIENAFNECQSLQPPAEEMCINEFSVLFVPPLFKDNFPALVTVCKKLPKFEYQRACFNGAAFGIKIGTGGNKIRNSPFCELLDDQFRRSCLETLEEELTWGRYY